MPTKSGALAFTLGKKSWRMISTLHGIIV